MDKKQITSLVLILVLVFLLIIYFNSSSSEESDNSKSGPNSQVTLFLPGLNSSTSIKLTDLDPTLRTFVVFGSIPDEISKGLLPDGTEGYRIVYKTDKGIRDTHLALLQSAKSLPFEIDSSVGKSLSTLISSESSKYKVKTTEEFINDKETRVTVNIEIKQGSNANK